MDVLCLSEGIYSMIGVCYAIMIGGEEGEGRFADSDST